MSDRLERLEEVLGRSEAYAAMVFGSFARQEDYSDIDIAVFVDGTTEEIVRELPAVFDIQRFDDLPLYIRKRVLEEGSLVYCDDKDRFYDNVIKTVKAYEDFRPIHEEYLEKVRSRG